MPPTVTSKKKSRGGGEGGGCCAAGTSLHRGPQHNHATLCADKQGKGATGKRCWGGGGLACSGGVGFCSVQKMSKGSQVRHRPPRSQARPQRCCHCAAPWTNDAGWVHPGGALASMPLEGLLMLAASQYLSEMPASLVERTCLVAVGPGSPSLDLQNGSVKIDAISQDPFKHCVLASCKV